MLCCRDCRHLPQSIGIVDLYPINSRTPLGSLALSVHAKVWHLRPKWMLGLCSGPEPEPKRRHQTGLRVKPGAREVIFAHSWDVAPAQHKSCAQRRKGRKGIGRLSLRSLRLCANIYLCSGPEPEPRGCGRHVRARMRVALGSGLRRRTHWVITSS